MCWSVREFPWSRTRRNTNWWEGSDPGSARCFIRIPLVIRRSFGVECRDRIKAHGAKRRDVTGSDGDRGEYGSYAGEDGEVVGRDTVKQAGHEMRNDDRTNEAHNCAGGRHTEALAQNHPEDMT